MPSLLPNPHLFSAKTADVSCYKQSHLNPSLPLRRKRNSTHQLPNISSGFYNLTKGFPTRNIWSAYAPSFLKSTDKYGFVFWILNFQSVWKFKIHTLWLPYTSDFLVAILDNSIMSQKLLPLQSQPESVLCKCFER